MKSLQWHEIVGLAVKQVGRPAVYVSNGLDISNTEDANVWIFVLAQVKKFCGDDTGRFHDMMASLVSCGLFFFGNEKEQREFYRIFESPLTDSSAIYACTYDDQGTCMTENT
jgi:hypothetical protein